MKVQTHSRTTLFLMEMIIAIAVFAVSAAIAVRIFTAAHQSSAQSVNLSAAVQKAQTAAELFKKYGLSDACAEMLQAYPENGSLYVAYDAQWNPCSQETSPAFLLELCSEGETAALITVLPAGSAQSAPIFVLRTERLAEYENGGGSNE